MLSRCSWHFTGFLFSDLPPSSFRRFCSALGHFCLVSPPPLPRPELLLFRPIACLKVDGRWSILHSCSSHFSARALRALPPLPPRLPSQALLARVVLERVIMLARVVLARVIMLARVGEALRRVS